MSWEQSHQCCVTCWNPSIGMIPTVIQASKHLIFYRDSCFLPISPLKATPLSEHTFLTGRHPAQWSVTSSGANRSGWSVTTSSAFPAPTFLGTRRGSCLPFIQCLRSGYQKPWGFAGFQLSRFFPQFFVGFCWLVEKFISPNEQSIFFSDWMPVFEYLHRVFFYYADSCFCYVW